MSDTPHTHPDAPAILRAVRAWHDLSVVAVAAETGLHRDTITYAERGHRLSRKTWDALCAFYAARGQPGAGAD